MAMATAAAEAFAAGDVVWLRSGGPPMTVCDVQGPMACCWWWAGAVIGSAWFGTAMLTHAAPKG